MFLSVLKMRNSEGSDAEWSKSWFDDPFIKCISGASSSSISRPFQLFPRAAEAEEEEGKSVVVVAVVGLKNAVICSPGKGGPQVVLLFVIFFLVFFLLSLPTAAALAVEFVFIP